MADLALNYTHMLNNVKENMYRKWTIAGSSIAIYEINIENDRAMLIEKIRAALHLTSSQLFANFLLDLLHEQSEIEDQNNRSFSEYFDNLLKLSSEISVVISQNDFRAYFEKGSMLPLETIKTTLDFLPITQEEFSGLIWLLLESDYSEKLYDPANYQDKHRTEREIVAANAVEILFERRNRQITQGIINTFFEGTVNLANSLGVSADYIDAFQDRYLATWEGYIKTPLMEKHPHNKVLNEIATTEVYRNISFSHPLVSPVTPKQFRNTLKIQIPKL